MRRLLFLLLLLGVASCVQASSLARQTRHKRTDEDRRRVASLVARRNDLSFDEKLSHLDEQLKSGDLDIDGHDAIRAQFSDEFKHQADTLFSVDEAKVALLAGSKDLGFHDAHHTTAHKPGYTLSKGQLQHTPTPESNYTAGQEACTSPERLVAWSNVEPEDKRAFIEAVKRLTTIPSKLGGMGSLYDDFTGTHVFLSYSLHGTCLFLPGHRALMVAFYRAIRQECGYRGPMVFWDVWTNATASDPKSFTHHPIFDDKLGFGGTGDSKDSYRIKNGPFAGFMVNYTRDELHPGKVKYDPHAITRRFALFSKEKTPHSFFLSTDALKWVLQAPNYYDFEQRLQMRIHGSAHHAVGGQFNFLESVNDAAMFWSLHGFIECMWQKRQHMAGGRFKHDFEGWVLPHRKGPRCTKDTPITTLGLYLEDGPLGEYFDTTKAGLCFECDRFDFLDF